MNTPSLPPVAGTAFGLPRLRLRLGPRVVSVLWPAVRRLSPPTGSAPSAQVTSTKLHGLASGFSTELSGHASFLQPKAMPQCGKFKKAPLQHENNLDIIYDGASCTNESALVPRAEGAAHVNLGDDEGEGDEPTSEEETTTPKESPHVDKGKKTARPKRAAHDSPSGKKSKKSFKDVQLKRLVGIVERSHGSKNFVNNAPSPVVDPVRQEICEMIDLVIEAGAGEGSDEHFYATQLIIKKEY